MSDFNELETEVKKVRTTIDVLKKLKYPAVIRAKIEFFWHMIKNGKPLIEKYQKYITKNMDNLQKQQELTDEFIKVSEKFKDNQNMDFIKKNQAYTRENMGILKKQQQLIDQINDLYNDFKTKLNENAIGTLHGRTRQTIKNDNILSNDVHARHELGYDYDEADAMQRNKNGGKKRRIKNKTHKKSRIFIRNK